jgi:type I restriction enzyme, S subunit
MQCFDVQSDDIEGRLDVFYYQPEFIELERKIRENSTKTLGDFIINISSGATPEKDESEKYYTDSPENGVPFLRVQNVTESGLSLEDCKCINFDTHSGMLKRSQVKEGDLITKITGVGRMAISSVAPKGFDGNVNQHLVVIKTDSYQTSMVLAAFLNSDIGERLAFRRSTGGTRPALDYQALRTIPIVFNSNLVDIMQSAYAQKKEKEAEAQRLLDSIDEYVLDELGIKLPEIKIKKCFLVWNNEVVQRLDPLYYSKDVFSFLKEFSYDVKSLEGITYYLKTGFAAGNSQIMPQSSLNK